MSKALAHRNIPGLLPESGAGTEKDPCVAEYENEDGDFYEVKWWWEDPKKQLRFRSHGTKVGGNDTEPPKTTGKKRGKKGKS